MKKPNRVRVDTQYGNDRVRVTVPEWRPSWRRFGNGVGNAEFTFYTRTEGGPCLGVSIEETAFAGIGDKRDVSKAVMLELDRDAMAAIHAALGKALDV